MRILKSGSQKFGINLLVDKIQCNATIENWGHLESTCGGWAHHHNGVYKAQKENLQSIVTDLDTQAEFRTLTNDERNQLESARDDLIKLLREEELKYYQRAKVTDILLGDNNTRYFIWLQMANIVRNISSP